MLISTLVCYHAPKITYSMRKNRVGQYDNAIAEIAMHVLGKSSLLFDRSTTKECATMKSEPD
jgi:hypothetical protein